MDYGQPTQLHPQADDLNENPLMFSKENSNFDADKKNPAQSNIAPVRPDGFVQNVGNTVLNTDRPSQPSFEPESQTSGTRLPEFQPPVLPSTGVEQVGPTDPISFEQNHEDGQNVRLDMPPITAVNQSEANQKTSTDQLSTADDLFKFTSADINGKHLSKEGYTKIKSSTGSDNPNEIYNNYQKARESLSEKIGGKQS